MNKPRIFLGSSGKQEKLLQALTRGLEDVAHVEPWTTSFNPGTTTLERLLELAHEVDFAAFVFAQDDWTTQRARGITVRPGPVRLLRETMSSSKPAFSVELSECAEPSSSTRAARSFQAISSASRAYVTAKRPRRRDESRQPEASQGDRERGPRRPHRRPVVAVFPDGAHRAGAFRREPAEDFAGPRRRAGAGRPFMARGWQPVGEILERSGEGEEGAFGRLLLLEGRTAAGPERAAVGRDGRDPDGVGRARVGYFTTRADTHPKVNARTSGVYLRADPEDMSILDGRDDRKRAELIAERLRHWKSIKNA